jgi:hypothetical protein
MAQSLRRGAAELRRRDDHDLVDGVLQLDIG